MFPSPTGRCCFRLELHFEDELILPWNVVRIVLGYRTKGRVAKLLVSAIGVVDVEVRRVGDVQGFDTELQVHTLRDRKVLEERHVDVAEVGAKERVALGVPDGSEGLRSKGRRIEELRQSFVTERRVHNRVGTIGAAAILRNRTIAESETVRVVCAATRFDDREGLSALPDGDHIGLPSGEDSLFDAGEFLTVLDFVVERESKTVLDVV